MGEEVRQDPREEKPDRRAEGSAAHERRGEEPARAAAAASLRMSLAESLPDFVNGSGLSGYMLFSSDIFLVAIHSAPPLKKAVTPNSNNPIMYCKLSKGICRDASALYDFA